MEPLILVNRFIINLRSAGTGTNQSSNSQPLATVSDIDFQHAPPRNSFLGNVGEDLQHGYDDSGDEHEEDVSCIQCDLDPSPTGEELYVVRA